MARTSKPSANAEKQPAILTPEARRAEMDAREDRYDQIERILIQYPRWNAILDEINFIHRHAFRSAEPRGLLLVGPKGAGKSTLLDVYAETYPPDLSGEIIKRPIVIATVPSRATPDALASALLSGMEDPRWDKGSLANKTLRLMEYFRLCETRLLMLDETQHFEDRGSDYVLEEGARWLKNLIKDKQVRIAVVFVALEGHTTKLMQANDGQLGRLFGTPHLLSPLAWVESKCVEDNEFRCFLDEVELGLPFTQRSNLIDVELAWRCFVATEGVVNWIMKLIRRAAYIAVDLGRDHIDIDILHEAFSKELAGELLGIPNPFEGSRPVLRAKSQAHYVPAAQLEGKPRKPKQKKDDKPKEDSDQSPQTVKKVLEN